MEIYTITDNLRKQEHGVNTARKTSNFHFLTCGIKIVEDLVHSNDLIVQFIVRCWTWKKSVTISDEKVENIYYLQKKIKL